MKENPMKRRFTCVLIAGCLLFPSFIHSAIRVSVSANILLPRDSVFKEVYGSPFLPQVEFDLCWKEGGPYLWSSYGYISSSGKTTNLEEKSKIDQHNISAGVGWETSGRVRLQVKIGALAVSWKERAMGESASGTPIGGLAEIGLFIPFGKVIFIDVSVGYSSATQKMDGFTMKFGGATAGIGFGVAF
jgi:hypothetical protein